MKRLGLSLTGPSPFIINMANQTPAVPLGMIKEDYQRRRIYGHLSCHQDAF